MDRMQVICCEAVMVFQTSLRSTPGISLMMMYSAPTGLSLCELHASTSGTGTFVNFLTVKCKPVSLQELDIRCRTTARTEFQSSDLRAHSTTRRSSQLGQKSRNHRLPIVEPDHENTIEAAFFLVAAQHSCSIKASFYRKTE
jgi:hypothetical protein